MEKVELKTSFEEISPDNIYVPAWNISCNCNTFHAFPLLYSDKFKEYGFSSLIIGDCGEYHSDIKKYIIDYLKDSGVNSVMEMFSDVDYLRIWVHEADEGESILVSWGDDNDITEQLEKVVTCLRTSDFDLIKDSSYPKTIIEKQHGVLPSSYINIDINKLRYYWEGYEYEEIAGGEEIEVRYGYREFVTKLISSGEDINKANDEQQKLFHLMTPLEKAEYLKNNSEKQKEIEQYFDEGEEAWDEKHPGWDPAQYHLTFYQEGKEMKIKEDDIKSIVNECLKKLLKEDVNTTNIDVEFNQCIETLQRVAYKMEAVKNEVLTCANNVLNYLESYRGIQIINPSYELKDEGLVINGVFKITDFSKVPEDYDINNLSDVEEYISDTILDLSSELFEWNKYRYIEDITRNYRSGILIEFEECNPINIVNKLPDV